MITIRSSHDRGSAHFGWLEARHTFSFGNYYDPAHMGFGSLRVINEDKVQPSQGFPTHGHRDMEIITYILEGALEHKDSIGNGSIIRPGDVQRMSAGTGILHSEFNASQTDRVHLLQIWIVPEQIGLEPGYEQIHVPAAEKQGKLRLIGSPEGREGSVTIHQQADLYATHLRVNEQVAHTLRPGRQAWIQVARGAVELNDRLLSSGDGAAVVGESTIALKGVSEDAEVLLFDLAA
jgi:redox-sensitive bicupin YhaK (pirin superfamily)